MQKWLILIYSKILTSFVNMCCINGSISGVDGVFEGWDFYKDHPECAYMRMDMRTEETKKRQICYTVVMRVMVS
jgi:hypothetical protein